MRLRLAVLAVTLAALVGAQPSGAADSVYWANAGGTIPISFARLDGSGGGPFNISGPTASGPRGLAIDPAAGRIY